MCAASHILRAVVRTKQQINRIIQAKVLSNTLRCVLRKRRESKITSIRAAQKRPKTLEQLLGLPELMVTT